jgi:hypothetical protein
MTSFRTTPPTPAAVALTTGHGLPLTTSRFFIPAEHGNTKICYHELG